mgnify:CR=1 FL=1
MVSVRHNVYLSLEMLPEAVFLISALLFLSSDNETSTPES